MEDLQNDNLEEIIKNNPHVVVQYGATWCGMCKIIKPKLTRIASENPGVKFVYVDAEKFLSSRSLVDIENLPTIAGFKNGELIKSLATTKEEAILEIVNETASN